MSNLDPGQFDLGVIWCADPVATQSEMKGGQQWNPGDDISGVGTPDNPYGTPEQCLKEIRIAEGQAQITKDWKIRCLTDPLEDSQYPRIDRVDSGVSFPESDTFYVIFEGWLKEWGISSRGTWLDISHKPTIGGYINSAGNDKGIRKLIFVDLKIVTDEFDHVALALDDSSNIGLALFYGCEFDRFHLIGLIRVTAGTKGSFSRFLACTFRVGVTSSIGIGNIVDLVNCFIYTDKGDALFYDADSGGGQITRYFRTLNCLIVVDGSNFLIHNNANGGQTITDTSLAVRSHNRYHLKNGALFAQWSITEPIEPNFVATPPYDEQSSQGDPLLAVEGEPMLANISPILDKGGSLGGVFATALNDLSGNNYHEIDALGFPWGDSLDNNTPLTCNGNSRFSHRSIGPVQQPLGFVPPQSVMIFPVGVIPQSTIYVVGKVGLDPDSLGTCQVKVIQADDDSATTGVFMIDSAPLEVTSDNQNIDIMEDGFAAVNVQVAPGIYNTTDLHTAIEAALNSSGLVGNYTVTYSAATRKTTISATGLSSGFVLQWASGLNASSSVRALIGFESVDTVQALSIESDHPIDENFFRTDVTFEFSSDYVEGEDPATSGQWQNLGVGQPGDSGIEGVNGVACNVDPRYVRVNLGDVSPVNDKHHGWQAWSGTLKSDDVVV